MCRKCACPTGEFQCSNFLLNHPTPQLFMESQWNWPPVAYVIYRWVWMVFFIILVILSAVLPYAGGALERQRTLWPTYLTSWAYLLLTVYVIFAAATSLAHYLNIKNGKPTVQYMTWYLQLQWFLYNLSTIGALGVTTGFWTLFWKYGEFLNAISFNTHVLNSVYVLIDLFITATPMRVLHFWYGFILGLAYSSFMLFYQAVHGTDGIVYIPINFYEDPGMGALFLCLGIPLLLLIWAGVFGLFVVRTHLSRSVWTCGRNFGAPPGEDQEVIVVSKKSATTAMLNSAIHDSVEAVRYSGMQANIIPVVVQNSETGVNNVVYVTDVPS